MRFPRQTIPHPMMSKSGLEWARVALCTDDRLSTPLLSGYIADSRERISAAFKARVNQNLRMSSPDIVPSLGKPESFNFLGFTFICVYRTRT